MNRDDKDIVVDHLIDIMTELALIENQVRALRQNIEPFANKLIIEDINRD
ncbi:hypothetical protein [Cohaesibacter sp. CAU 1516]|nr:hypothetical protein [Cohaesibacter sp. CAU 1516]